MNKEIKAKWLAALRSGEYVHGIAQLRIVEEGSPVKHCCLGVLCDIMSKEGKGKWIPGEPSTFVYGDDVRFGAVPDKLAEELGAPELRSTSDGVAIINDRSKDYTPAIEYIEKNF